MYEEYWKLKEKPFKNTPDPRFLYYSPQHEDALMKLTYTVTEGMGGGVMTGVFGCGKTVVGYALMHNLGKKYKFAYVSNPQLTFPELLRAIVRSLNPLKLPDKKSELMTDSLLEILKDILVNNNRDGKETVIVVDEAHIIEDAKVFEGLRLLLNFQTEKKFLLSLLLVGQPELMEKIENIKQLEQRMAMKCHLDRLNEKETGEYIVHRLKVAGREKVIFGPSGIHFVYEHSGGIPRRINHICDLSLLSGFGKKVDKIESDLIEQVTKDFGI